VQAGFQGASATMGHALQQDTMIGPVADKKQFDSVMSFIESGKKEAELITGGTRKGDKGNFIEPTIFINPNKDAKIVKEEIFGPVVSIQTFKTEEEVIEMANNTSYGLSCKSYSRNYCIWQ
jgi:aldehyde dehydrogenase (NAD+)